MIAGIVILAFFVGLATGMVSQHIRVIYIQSPQQDPYLNPAMMRCFSSLLGGGGMGAGAGEGEK